MQQIIALREKGGRFTSIEDFARRIPSKLLNKKFIEALDSFGNREVFVAHYDRIADFSRASGDIGTDQTELFSGTESASSVAHIEFLPTTPAPLTLKLQWEKEF